MYMPSGRLTHQAVSLATYIVDSPSIAVYSERTAVCACISRQSVCYR